MEREVHTERIWFWALHAVGNGRDNGESRERSQGVAYPGAEGERIRAGPVNVLGLAAQAQLPERAVLYNRKIVECAPIEERRRLDVERDPIPELLLEPNVKQDTVPLSAPLPLDHSFNPPVRTTVAHPAEEIRV